MKNNKLILLISAAVMAGVMSLTGCSNFVANTVNAVTADDWISTDDYTKDKVDKRWVFKNMDAMYEVLGVSPEYTYDDVREAVAKNESITEEFAPYFYEYLDKLEAVYPNMNLFCLCRNMQTLDFRPRTTEDMEMKFGKGCVGNYKSGENALYFDYETETNNTYLLDHEMSHMVTNHWSTWKGYELYFDFDRFATSVAVKEALNSIFLESIIGYTIEDMSYRLPVNHVNILLEYADTTLEDVLKHDRTYFENVIDEALGEPNGGRYTASLINQMIDLGFGYQGYELDRDYADYYTGKIYFHHCISADMSHDELVDVYNTLLTLLTDGVSSGSSTTTVHDFNDLQAAFFEVLESTGIAEAEKPQASELKEKFEYPRRRT